MIRTSLAIGLLAASPVLAAPPSLATDIPVTQALVAAVASPAAPPALLLDPGADPHHAALRPSQARLVSRADLVISVGAGLTPWLDDAVSSLGDADTMLLAEVPGTHVLPSGEEPAAHAEDHEAGHADHDHPDHGEDHGRGTSQMHDHGPVDPHLWLDPENAAIWLPSIAEALAERDPAGAAAYRARAAAAGETVAEAVHGISGRIEAAAGRPILAAHDAWAYAAEAFGFEIAGHIADSEAAAPGAAHLSDVYALIEADRPSCILAAPGDPMAIAERVSQETGIPIVLADPLGTGEGGIEGYIGVLENLATAIESCADGGS